MSTETPEERAERFVSAFMGDHEKATVYRERLVEMVTNAIRPTEEARMAVAAEGRTEEVDELADVIANAEAHRSFPRPPSLAPLAGDYRAASAIIAAGYSRRVTATEPATYVVVELRDPEPYIEDGPFTRDEAIYKAADCTAQMADLDGSRYAAAAVYLLEPIDAEASA